MELNPDLTNLFFKPWGGEAYPLQLSMENFKYKFMYLEKHDMRVIIGVAFRDVNDAAGYIFTTADDQIEGEIEHVLFTKMDTKDVEVSTLTFIPQTGFSTASFETLEQMDVLTLIQGDHSDLNLLFEKANTPRLLPLYLYRNQLKPNPETFMGILKNHAHVWDQMKESWPDERLLEWEPFKMNMVQDMSFHYLVEEHTSKREKTDFMKLVLGSVVDSFINQSDFTNHVTIEQRILIASFLKGDEVMGLLLSNVLSRIEKGVQVNYDQQVFKEKFLVLVKDLNVNLLCQYIEAADAPADKHHPPKNQNRLTLPLVPDSWDVDEQEMGQFVVTMKLRLAWIFYVHFFQGKTIGVLKHTGNFMAFQKKLQDFLVQNDLETELAEVQTELVFSVLRYVSVGVMEAFFHLSQLKNLDDFIKEYVQKVVESPGFKEYFVVENKFKQKQVNIGLAKQVTSYFNPDRAMLSPGHKKINFFKKTGDRLSRRLV